MRKILFILLLLSGRAMAQMSTPPVTYVIIYPNDTIRDYWDSQRIIDYVATHGGSGFGSATLTGEAKIDADGNDILWQNTANYIIGYGNHAGQMGTFNTATADIGDAGSYNQSSDGTGGEFESYSDNVGGSFTHWLLDVGGVQAVLVDSGAQQGTYGYGGTNWVADDIAGMVTVNAAGGVFTSIGGYFLTDNDNNVTAGVENNELFTNNSDGSIGTNIITASDGSSTGINMRNALSSISIQLSTDGTTINLVLPSYASQADAILGGKVTGDWFYDTGLSGGGVDIVQ